jgi:cyclophilin family peptidyl-prolyl cis-trans isomerase
MSVVHMTMGGITVCACLYGARLSFSLCVCAPAPSYCWSPAQIKLFPEFAPVAVENFATHARAGYYNGHLFHRVIAGFMVQTGDPQGDGTGGISIWGGEFKDEFHPNLRHDRPYTVSMANAGPNTNGSQFFITVVPTVRVCAPACVSMCVRLCVHLHACVSMSGPSAWLVYAPC